MKTRMELWKNYREEIAQNAQLKHAVIQSDKKMQILRKRILAIFPDFFKKHTIDFDSKKLKTTNLPKQKVVEFVEGQEAIEEINDFEKQSQFSLSEIDKINFSSNLEENLKELKENGKVTFFQNHKLHIAIDGPSASGKSSVAKTIAKKFDMKYINTGLVYRTIALVLMENSIDLKNEKAIEDILSKTNISLLKNENVLLNNQNISLKLRKDAVSKKASQIASLPFIRKFATNIIQKSIASDQKIIMDGRDTTFKILPNADLKFFIDSQVEERAKRRFKQNKELGFEVNYENILNDLIARDKRDYSRKIDPLQIVKDAIVVDSTKLSFDQVITFVVNKVELFLARKNNEK